MLSPSQTWARYKLRIKRKRLLWRAFRKRREISCISRKTGSIRAEDILLFATVRNESLRLPYFLEHYRKLGVGHFLIVDNDSDDGTREMLAAQADVSLWSTAASYKAARFGMDWLTCLHWRYAHKRWIITVDADELLIYPHWDTQDLGGLARVMENNGAFSVGALMLDMYPNGPVQDQTYRVGQDPTDVIPWFDAYGYWVQKQPKMQNLWVQGGPRARCFFADDPARAPTMNKIPFLRWDRSFVYVNSTHNALPSRLNHTHGAGGSERPTGVLLHTKFLPDASIRAQMEQVRCEHFADPTQYDDYYAQVIGNPDFWCRDSVRYEGWRQLVDLGVMSEGTWPHS
ncbi:MAG: glycosyltransferase family 2 protein [Roseobacter sp.]